MMPMAGIQKIRKTSKNAYLVAQLVVDDGREFGAQRAAEGHDVVALVRVGHLRVIFDLLRLVFDLLWMMLDL